MYTYKVANATENYADIELIDAPERVVVEPDPQRVIGEFEL